MSAPKKAFATRPAPEEIVKYLSDNGVELTCWAEGRNPTADELCDILKDYQGYLNVSFGKIDRDFIQRNSHLSVACTYSVGYDHIDIKAATELGLPIGNTPDVLSKATAESAFLLMIMAARRAQHNYHRLLDNKWGFSGPLDNCGYDLTGKTVGIFGLGRIGAEFAMFCKGAYNMNVIYHNRNRNTDLEEKLDAKYVSFDELLSQSDVISLHAFASADNFEKFNYDAFSKMKKTAILVNTARGSLINESDLAHAIDEKLIFAAGLDVFHIEPLPADHIFRTNKDIVLLPHIGSATIETRMDMWKLSADNLIAGLHGKELPACVNPQVYKKD